MGLPLYDSNGKFGYRSRDELTNLLSFVINKTPRKDVFESQITREVEEELYDYFELHNNRLKTVLGFDTGYDEGPFIKAKKAGSSGSSSSGSDSSSDSGSDSTEEKKDDQGKDDSSSSSSSSSSDSTSSSSSSSSSLSGISSM